MKPKFQKLYNNIAHEVAKMSHARRLQVGAVIVKDDRVISMGYNGMPAGWDNVCECDGKTKPEVLHAEANAITKVARSSESTEGAELYTTTAPCIDCAKLIYQSGIERVFYRTPHLRTDDGIDFLDKCRIFVGQM